MSIQDSSESRSNSASGAQVLWRITGVLAIVSGAIQIVFALWWTAIGFPQIGNFIWAVIGLITVAGGVLAWLQLRLIAPWIIVLSAALVWIGSLVLYSGGFFWPWEPFLWIESNSEYGWGAFDIATLTSSSLAQWLVILAAIMGLIAFWKSSAQARIDLELNASNPKEIVMSMNDGVAPGWYTDPSGLPTDRYWDGASWTEQTRPRVPGVPGTYSGSGGVRSNRNGMGTAALTLGIIGIFLGWLFSLLAIIFGSLGIGRANRGEATNKSAATWGLWLGIVGIVLWIMVVLVVVGSSI